MAGPSVLQLSAGGEGSVREQWRRETQDQATPASAPSSRQRGPISLTFDFRRTCQVRLDTEGLLFLTGSILQLAGR